MISEEIAVKGSESRLRFHVTFWMAVLTVVVAASQIQELPLQARSRLVSAESRWLLLSVAFWGAGAAVWGLVLLRNRGWGGGPLARGFGAGLILAAPAACLIMSLSPGGELAPEREYIIDSARGERLRYGAIVWFGNASDVLAPAEKSKITDLLEVLARCREGAVLVRGFASSAEFAGPKAELSDHLNLELANRRADALAKILERTGIQASVNPWPSFLAMASARGIVDKAGTGERILEKERLNRRAEFSWERSKACEGSE